MALLISTTLTTTCSVPLSLEKSWEGEMESYFSAQSHLAANIITCIQEYLEHKSLNQQQVLINTLRWDGVEDPKLRDQSGFIIFSSPDLFPPIFSFSDLLEFVQKLC